MIQSGAYRDVFIEFEALFKNSAGCTNGIAPPESASTPFLLLLHSDGDSCSIFTSPSDDVTKCNVDWLFPGIVSKSCFCKLLNY